MKISFQQSGGFAGLIRGCTVDTDSLPAGEAEALKSLVERSGAGALHDAHDSAARDLGQYEIEIDAGPQRCRLCFDELNVPETVTPLLDFLKARARPMPPPK